MNRRNYQKELDELIMKYEEAGIRPSLLMHTCCAPCSSYVMEYLCSHFDLTMYFYNPNMDSEEEYRKRASELLRLVHEMGNEDRIRVVIGEYEPQRFDEIAAGHEADPERGPRCRRCYRLRLEKTVQFMQQYNREHPDKPLDYFATTLTLSPLKDAAVLNEIGEQLAQQYELKCLATEFKKKNGFKRSIELSKEYSLYRQNYCGCRFSKKEAELREERKAAAVS